MINNISNICKVASFYRISYKSSKSMNDMTFDDIIWMPKSGQTPPTKEEFEAKYNELEARQAQIQSDITELSALWNTLPPEFQFVFQDDYNKCLQLLLADKYQEVSWTIKNKVIPVEAEAGKQLLLDKVNSYLVRDGKAV